MLYQLPSPQNTNIATTNYIAVPGFKTGYFDRYPSTVKQGFIIDAVCRKFGVTEEELKSRVRKRRIVEARQVCMYLLKKKTKLTLKAIGDLFDRDHTTVMHSDQTVKDLMAIDKEYKIAVEDIEEGL